MKKNEEKKFSREKKKKKLLTSDRLLPVHPNVGLAATYPTIAATAPAPQQAPATTPRRRAASNTRGGRR